MSVSRLDSFQILTALAANTNAGATAGENPATAYPINGLVAVHVFGTFGGGSVSLEVTPDGTNWVTASGQSTALTAAGVITWTGVANGVRAKVTGSTSPSLNAIAMFQDQN